MRYSLRFTTVLILGLIFTLGIQPIIQAKELKINRDRAISAAIDFVVMREWQHQYDITQPAKIELRKRYQYQDGTTAWKELTGEMKYEIIDYLWIIDFACRADLSQDQCTHLQVAVDGTTSEIVSTSHAKE